MSRAENEKKPRLLEQVRRFMRLHHLKLGGHGVASPLDDLGV